MKAALLTGTLALIMSAAGVAQQAKDNTKTDDAKTIKDTAKVDGAKEGKETKDAKDPHEGYADESVKALEKVADILAGVKDRRSADEARTKLADAIKPLAELKRQLAENEPSKDRRAELEKKYKPKFEAAIKRFREEAVRVTAVDGGKEVLDELDRLLKPLVLKKG